MSSDTKTQNEDVTFEQSAYFSDKLIEQANSVELSKLFDIFNVKLSSISRKIKCPFPSHSGGKEHSPSFFYYPDTNSFYCFGCKRGGLSSHSVEFVSFMKEINKFDAADFIISHFNHGNAIVYNKTAQISKHIEFSDAVFNFREIYKDEKSFLFIEEISKAYDILNDKYVLNDEALDTMIKLLKAKIDAYK